MIEEEPLLNIDKDTLQYNELNQKIKRITTIIMDILLIFKENKIDESHTSNKRNPKFLTTQSLIEIQLNDVFFRKIICVQMILFFYNLKNPGKNSQKFKLTLKEEHVQILNECEQNVRGSLKLICKNLKEKNLAEQIDLFLEQEQFWSSLKDQSGKFDENNFNSAPVQADILNAFKLYNNINKPGVSQYCKDGFDFQTQWLKNLRNFKTGDQNPVCSRNSLIKNVINIDLNKEFIIPTRPMEPLCGYYFDQVYQEMKEEVQNDEKIKENKNYVWKAFRTLARFDVAIMRNDSKKNELLNLEDVARKIIKEYGTDQQKQIFQVDDKKNVEPERLEANIKVELEQEGGDKKQSLQDTKIENVTEKNEKIIEKQLQKIEKQVEKKSQKNNKNPEKNSEKLDKNPEKNQEKKQENHKQETKDQKQQEEQKQKQTKKEQIIEIIEEKVKDRGILDKIEKQNKTPEIPKELSEKDRAKEKLMERKAEKQKEKQNQNQSNESTENTKKNEQDLKRSPITTLEDEQKKKIKTNKD